MPQVMQDVNQHPILTEVPGSLKKLARLVVRGFYSIETVIVVDMLIRNPCMKEDDLVELLKFERKQLRAIIATLKNDKFIRVKLKMETGPDGKATRQNYYYINYKVFVNVVKYKLDHMRRKIELEERDSTSRSSFKCPDCLKTFTDLEANQLFDAATGEFRCTFCNATVDEDESAVPKQDSRLVQAKFNEQTEPLYSLLQDVEDVRLAPELLEPEPTDLTDVKRDAMPKGANQRGFGGDQQGMWSGDATRSRQFGVEQDVQISFGDDNANETAAAIAQAKKERPVWMVESTVDAPQQQPPQPSLPPPPAVLNVLDDESISAFPSVISIPDDPAPAPPKIPTSRKHNDDIMEVLLAHEKKSGESASAASVIPGVETDGFGMETETYDNDFGTGVEEMDDDDDDDEVPMVTVGDQNFPLHEITEEIIARMTPSEKDAYIKLGQEVYSNIYD